jgi:hypothetical protein
MLELLYLLLMCAFIKFELIYLLKYLTKDFFKTMNAVLFRVNYPACTHSLFVHENMKVPVIEKSL